MRNNLHLFGLFLAFFFLALELSAQTAQTRRFHAGLIAGLNASQIDGDQLAGFNRIGVSAGIRGSAVLSEKFDLNVEMLYSQRGSRPDIFNALLEPDINIALQYAEIPVYIGFYDWKVDDYYKVKVHAGLSYGRLISARTQDAYVDDQVDLEDLSDSFNKNDLSWIIGGSIFFSPRFGITIRYTRFINKLLDPSKVDVNTAALRSYFLTFRADYNF